MEMNPITGTCGENLTFSLQNGVLHIEGAGRLEIWNAYWKDYIDQIEHVVISPGCTSIGNYVFRNHPVLKTIHLPDTLRTIGRYAFADCYSLEEALLPDTVMDLGQSVFRNCHNLRQVHIPVRLRVLPKCTFCGCHNLTSIMIPEGVTGIGERAFLRCHRLTSITIPESVTRIGQNAFSCCYSLSSITIPGSVRTVGAGAFSECSGQIDIMIPDSVPKVGAFNAASVRIPAKTKRWRWSDGWVHDRTHGGIEIGETQVCWTVGQTSITIPVSEMKIGWKYSGLTSVRILDGVAEIGERAFSGCDSLTSITIPDSVRTIGAGAFEDVPHIIYNGPAQSDNNWGALSRN